MTGEDGLVGIAGLDDEVLARERGLPQPGGRRPAPGDLVLLQSFLNTHFDLVDEWGADLLAGPERLVLSSRGGGSVDVAVGTLLVIAVRAMIDGRWRRLKACPGEHCGWVFYDHSRNNSSRWCSMAVCGGRTKARSHYRRRRMGSVGDR